MILDSNLIIYAARPEYPGLRRLIRDQSPTVSAVSIVEVLGYHKLAAADRSFFEFFFGHAEILPINSLVISRAVVLRQARKLSLGDTLIAATALVFGQTLLTRNIKDFEGLPGLLVNDPLVNGDPG